MPLQQNNSIRLYWLWWTKYKIQIGGTWL